MDLKILIKEDLDRKMEKIKKRFELKKLDCKIIESLKKLGKVKIDRKVEKEIVKIIEENGYTEKYVMFIDESNTNDILTDEEYIYKIVKYQIEEIELEEQIDLVVGWESEITENELYLSGLNRFNEDLLFKLENEEKRLMKEYAELLEKLDEYNENVKKVLDFNFRYSNILY